MATRGEIDLEELVHANKKRRYCIEEEMKSGGGYSYSDPALYSNWRKSTTQIYCGQGNPILFNAVSNIVRKADPANANTANDRCFPWVAMEECSSLGNSLSTSSKGNQTLNQAAFFKRGSSGPALVVVKKNRAFEADACVEAKFSSRPHYRSLLKGILHDWMLRPVQTKSTL